FLDRDDELHDVDRFEFEIRDESRARADAAVKARVPVARHVLQDRDEVSENGRLVQRLPRWHGSDLDAGTRGVEREVSGASPDSPTKPKKTLAGVLAMRKPGWSRATRALSGRTPRRARRRRRRHRSFSPYAFVATTSRLA